MFMVCTQKSVEILGVLSIHVEITVMDGGKCIFQLRGVRPFLSDKFDITKHKNYKFLEDYNKKNVFDIEEYIKRKGKVKLNRNTVITRLQDLLL